MKIKLNNGFWWSAGSTYGWKGAGIGIKMSNIEKAAYSGDEIIVISDYGKYKIDGNLALNETKKYQSYKRVKYNIILGIIPVSSFTKIKKVKTENKSDYEKSFPELFNKINN